MQQSFKEISHYAFDILFNKHFLTLGNKNIFFTFSSIALSELGFLLLE